MFKKYRHKESGDVVEVKIDNNAAYIKLTVEFLLKTMFQFKKRSELDANQRMLATLVEKPESICVKVLSLTSFEQQYKLIE